MSAPETLCAVIRETTRKEKCMKSFKAGIVMVVALVMAALGFMSCSSNSAKLVSITVTPTDPVYASGTQFTATGTFSDGLILNYTSEVIWSSSSPTVATVGMTAGTAGYVTVLSEGTTTITAVEPYNNFTSSSRLTIVKPSTITITPENPVMAFGKSHQFAATATYAYLLSDTTTTTATQSLMSSPTLTWSSSNTLATVSRGLVTVGTTAGTTVISATDTIFSGVSGTTPLTITPTILTSITVTPQTQTLSVDASQPFSAIGTFQDNSQLELTSSVNWTSSATGTVLVSNITVSKGYATAVAPGAAFIIATDPITSVTGSASVTVQ
jgi:hypothetical protein